MPDHQLELEGYSIILLGSFNPAIFQPLWFSDNALIRKEEASDAKITIIHRNASLFSTEWFSLQVTDGRFALETKDPTKSLPLRDLAVGTFKILHHTPITAFGINRFQHFKMASLQRWHSFGHHFAPKESWSAILDEPGLRALIMEGKPDKDKGIIQVRIEPSSAFEPGVMILVNEHHNLLKGDPPTSDEDSSFVAKVQSRWDDFISYTDKVSNQLFASSLASSVRAPNRRKR